MQRSFRFRSLLFLMVFAAFCSSLACAVAPPGGNTDVGSLLTTAERTNFEETTRYADVIELMNAFDRSSDRMHMTTFGYTYEGRALPMMVAVTFPMFLARLWLTVTRRASGSRAASTPARLVGKKRCS